MAEKFTALQMLFDISPVLQTIVTLQTYLGKQTIRRMSPL